MPSEIFEVDQPEQGAGTASLFHRAMASHRQSSFTGGKSGAFMYFSGDRRFIVKQITKAEHTVLLSFLDDYVAHMERLRDPTTGRVNSLLLRFVQ